MKQRKSDIYVFADWKELGAPKLMGILSSHYGKEKKAFSFEYDRAWIKTESHRLLDPDIQFFSGPQFPNNKENFGIFLDSMPDTWGRTLMKKKAAQQAKEKGEKQEKLYDINYLLGVFDKTRMGALRFKTSLDGPFLDDDNDHSTPPWSSIRALQAAAKNLEDDENINVKKWLAILIAPGSSLGGARPKANIVDENGGLWIAKFPSKNDNIDKGAWEFLAYRLAIKCGVEMSPCKIEKIAGKYHTFFTKRFDRDGDNRIHFASAMTMTGNNEEILRFSTASYLDIAEFIMNYGANVDANLRQLWRRIVFNICISNTDDHLRNHGFILTGQGWVLSPAYDLNPSVEKNGLALNIDMDDNSLNLELAKSVGIYFRLNESDMNNIIHQIQKEVSQWQKIASDIGISRGAQELMAGAFFY